MSEVLSEEKPSVDLISRPNHVKFTSLSVASFAGLNFENTDDRSLIVVFEDNHIAEAQGDQGVGKTSLLNAIKAMLADGMPDNAINSKSKSKAGTVNFEHDGKKYKIKMTNSALTLLCDTGATDKKGEPIYGNIGRPIEMIKQLIGPIGVSPSFLQAKKTGEEQIKWIKSLTLGDKGEAEEAELKAKRKTAYDSRTEINREFDTLKNDLTKSGFYSWDNENHVLQATPTLNLTRTKLDKVADEKTIQANFDAALLGQQELAKYRQALSSYETKKTDTEDEITGLDAEIDELQRKIEEKKAAKIGKQEILSDILSRIEIGKKFIEEKKEADTIFEKASTELKESSANILAKKNVDDAMAKFARFGVVEKSRLEVNNAITDCDEDIKALAKSYTPDIEGLEIVTGGIDTVKPEGVYLNGVNLSWLSESQLWDFCLQIWRLTGVSVVFIENTTSLGTAAIDRINWFAEQGGYCFLSTMNRAFKEMKVSIINKIEG